MNRLVILLFSLLAAFLFPTWICDTSINFTNSFFSVIFTIVLFWFLTYVDNQGFEKRIKKYTLVLGIIFSTTTAFGFRLENEGKINYTDIKITLSILVFGLIYSKLLCVLWTFLEKGNNSLTQNQRGKFSDKAKKYIDFLLDRQWLTAIIIIIGWIPCYIATFPGNFIYDATIEFEQLTQGYIGDLPLLHSFIITRLLSVSYSLTGSYNVGVSIYTILQMVLISLLFSNIVCTFKKQGVNSILLAAICLYYMLFPVIHILVTCTVRDVMFSALLTYSMFLIYQLSVDFRFFLGSFKKTSTLAVVLVLTLLSRNNNTGMLMPAALVLIGLLLLIISYKKKIGIKGVLVFVSVALAGYFTINSALTAVCQPFTPAKAKSSLSVLSQPIARAYTLNKDEWDSDEKEQFAKYFNLKKVRYVAENADSTKNHLQIEDGEMGDFLRFWIKIGIKYPGCYLDGILANSRHMWFPDCVVDGYNESRTGSYTQYDKCYFSVSDRISPPATHKLYLPSVRKFYSNIGKMISFEKLPVISMLFSIGFNFWILLNCFFFICFKKYKNLILPLTIILCYTLISAFVPLVILRYFCALFFTLPIIAVFTLQPKAAMGQINKN